MRRAYIGAQALGAIAVASAALAARGAPQLGDQVGRLGLAILGLVIGGSANALWLLGGRLKIAHRLADLGRVLGERAPRVDVGSSDALLHVPNTLRYHRGRCAMVEGRAWVDTDAEAIDRLGLRPCELCA